MHSGPPGSSVHRILQARILEWVAMPSSRGSSQLNDWTVVSWVSCTAGGFFTAEPPGPVQVKSFWVHSNTRLWWVRFPQCLVCCGKDKVSAEVSVKAWPSFLNTEARNEKEGEKYFSLICTPGLYTTCEQKVFICETHIRWISNLGPVLYLMLGTDIRDKRFRRILWSYRIYSYS